MVGRLAGVIATLVVVGAVFAVSQPSRAAGDECGPVTLDMLFPGLDADGVPTTTTIAQGTEDTSTAGMDDTDPITHGDTSTTTLPEPGSTASDVDPDDSVCRTWVYDMGWPLASPARVFSGFGADRDEGERKHKGADIVAPKLTPVVAVADGTISIIHNTPGEDCCWMAITHEDNWQSWYIHLNNDTYLTDDGEGVGARTDLQVGSKVVTGEVIGWVGDSGNAEEAIPHLHFELRNPDGFAVDAAPSLIAAKDVADLESFRGPYRDDEGRPSEVSAALLASHGVLWSCDELGVTTCPDRLTSSAEIRDLIFKMTGVAPPDVKPRKQQLSFQKFLDEDELTIVLGCDPIDSCLQVGITAGDIARIAEWLMEADTASEGVAAELGNVRSAENSLRFWGRMGFCDPPVDNMHLINHSETIDYALWWVWGVGRAPCYDTSDNTS